MRVRVLGTTAVDGAAELAGRDRRVLAALVISGRRFCPTERLADALYGELPPPTWRKVVQGSVVRLRRVLGPLAIETTADGYRLAIGDDDVDVRRFEKLVADAGDLAAAGEHERAGLLLDEALELFAGDAFPDLDSWEPARAEAARLTQGRLLAEEQRVTGLLATGLDARAAILASELVEQQPLREQRWAALALAQYRTGRQGDALRSITRARRVLIAELGLEPGRTLVELERSILAQAESLNEPAPTPVASWSRESCPYKGLASYSEHDADDFFGREAAVQACVTRVAQVGTVVIVGASGSGKSSLARAGVAQRLRIRGRSVTVITPGPHPADVLATVPVDAALVVDQLEELFTLCSDPSERERFASALASRTGAAPLIATIRADHLASVAELPALAAVVEAGMFLLGPMDESHLRAVVEGPAARAGLRLEPGLVDVVLGDVRGQPGALPMLSYALAEAWSRREGRTLTIAGYHAGGGVQAAVAQAADRMVEALPPEGRLVARQLFLRLVVFSDDGQAARHRLRLEEVRANPLTAEVLDAMAGARLVTLDEGTVEVAHESLARAWPRLQAWFDEDREGERTRLHLSTSAAGWEAMGHDQAELYRGTRLRSAEEWASGSATLTPTERAFLDASLAARRSQEDDLEAISSARARTNRRLRLLLGATSVALAVALFAGAVAAAQSAQARSSARESALQALIEKSASQRGTKRDMATLLAVAAYRTAVRPDTVGGLLRTFTGSLGYERSVPVPGGQSVVGKLLADGRTYAAVDDRGGVHLVDIVNRQDKGALPPARTTRGDVSIDLSHDGRYLAVASDGPDNRNLLIMWDLTTHSRRFPDVALDFGFGAVNFSPDGTMVAVSGGPQARVEVLSASDGSLVAAVPSLPRPPTAHLHKYTAAVRFLGNDLLAVGSQSGVVRLVDPRTGNELGHLAGPPETSEASLTTTPDGRTLIGDGYGGTEAWELATGKVNWPRPAPGRCNKAIAAVVIGAVLCAQPDSRVRAFDLTTGTVLSARFDYQLGVVSDISVAEGGDLLIEVGGSALALWRLDGTGPIAHRTLSGAGLVPQAFDAAGRLLVVHTDPTSGDPVRPELVDARSGTVVDPLAGVDRAILTGDAGRLLAFFTDGTAGFYDVVAHRRLPGRPINVDFVPQRVARRGSTLILSAEGRMQGVDLGTGTLVPPAVSQDTAITGIVTDAGGHHLFTNEAGILGFYPRRPDGSKSGPLIEAVDAASSTRDLVTSSLDGHLRVLDATTFRPTGPELPPVIGLTNSLALNTDGQVLMVVARDRTIRVMDMRTRQIVGEPIPMGGTGDAVAVLRPDGRQLAYGDDNGIVVWDLSADTMATAACAVVGRNLTRAEWRSEVVGLGPWRRICQDQPVPSA